jgi:hypothetical protein
MLHPCSANCWYADQIPGEGTASFDFFWTWFLRKSSNFDDLVSLIAPPKFAEDCNACGNSAKLNNLELSCLSAKKKRIGWTSNANKSGHGLFVQLGRAHYLL